jgi:hypothetical protein
VRYRIVPPFFERVKRLKNEAKQKPLFLLCALEKARDGLFQQAASGAGQPNGGLIPVK